jgi:N-acetyl-alpha-D-glucosaminyl L-malate synthase BshA
LKLGIVCYPTYGGSGVVATELGQSLAARGHEVHLLSYAPPARWEAGIPGLHFHEVGVSSYPLFKYPPYDVALSSRLAEVAEDADLDLVHVHYAIPHAVAALLVKSILHPRPLPVVTTLHGTDITVVGQDPAYARVTRYAIEHSDVVTAVSRYLAAETREVFGTDREIHVVANSVDTERFHPQGGAGMRGNFSKGAEAVLMHVSNFRPVKRAALAVEAFAELVKHTPATLVMVGDGPDRQVCEQRARALGVRDRVRFVGPQAEVERLLPAADIFLLPSRYESFGLAALEAMACGVVPVVTDAGGLPEVVQDDVDGLLIPNAEINTMAERIRTLLGDPERLQSMKRAARHAAVTRFNRDRIVDEYLTLYEQAISGAPTTS